MAVGREESVNFVLREAEAVSVFVVEYRPNLRVVETGEDALLRDAENAGHHAKAAVLAVLERGRKEVPEELKRILAEPVRRGPVDGGIVLVDQDHRLLAVVRVQRGGENAKARFEVGRQLCPVKNVPEKRLGVFGTVPRSEDGTVAIGLDAHRGGDLAAHVVPVAPLRVLQRDVQDGVLPLLDAVFRILPDLRVLEEAGVRFLRLLEESLQHPQRERLAEPARAREERDRGLLVEKPGYELRLVGRPVTLGHSSPVAVADRKRKTLHGSSR